MKINFVLFIFCFAFLSGCSLQPTSTIEVSSDGTATISRVHRDIIDGAPIRHSEVLDSNVTFTQTINGHHFEVLDGNVKFGGTNRTQPNWALIQNALSLAEARQAGISLCWQPQIPV